MQCAEKHVPGNVPDIIDEQTFRATIDQHGLTFRVISDKTLQGAQILGTYSGCVLDFDGPEASGAVYDEIDLHAGACAPEEELAIASGVGDPGAQVLRYQALEGTTVDLFCPVQRAVWTE